MSRVSRSLARVAAIGLVVSTSIASPSPALAAVPTSQMLWTDGPQGYASAGHVQTPGVTFYPSTAPYAEVWFDPESTPMVTGFSGADGAQIAAGTYTDATFPQSAGHPYFRTYDAQVCWTPPNDPAGEFVVHEVAFDGGGVLSKLAVDLRYHCPGQTIQHYRVVRFNSSVPVSWLDLATSTYVGSTHVGVATDLSIPVTNLGASTQHVAGVALSGAQADQFAIHADGCSGQDVEPGASCAVVIRALPTQTGGSSARLTVTSDAFDAEISASVTQSATIATSVSLAGNSPTAVAGTYVEAHATVTPAPGAGIVYFYVDGGFAGFGYPDSVTGAVTGSLQPQSAGHHDLVASYSGQQAWDPSESDPLTIDFKQPTSVTLSSNHNPTLTASSVTLTAAANPTTLPPSGTLTITDETTSTVLASGPIGGAVNTLAVTTTFASIGTHVIRADLDSGDPEFLDSTTTLDEQVSLDDFVDATGLALSTTTFYPVKDGYRDTVAVKGIRNETASVAITVTSSATGKVVARGSVAAGSGPYSWSWSGTYSSGTVMPAGSYSIQQVLTDGSANTLGWTKSVTLSTKKLVTHTYTKTLYGNQFQSFGTSGSGTVRKQATPYANEVRLDGSPPGWAAAEWSFTLPAAVVNKSLRFYVTGSTSGPAVMGVWNPSYGSYLDVDAYDGARLIGRSYATYGVSVSPASHISAHHVHGIVFVGSPYAHGIANIARVKIVFTYGLLQ